MQALKVPVDEYATLCPVTVGPSTPILDVVRLMGEKAIRHLPVVLDRVPVGIISERALHALAHARDVDQLVAEDFMTPKPFQVHSGAPLSEVVLEMAERKIGSAIVMVDGEATAIFTATDALLALADFLSCAQTSR